MSQAGFQIPSLTGLRAVAVLLVFVGHTYTVPDAWPGHVGVTIFFFLSGFLIVTLLRREHAKTGSISMRRFYLRRVLRILPPAYVAIAASLTVGALGWLESDATPAGVVSELLNYTNYYIVFSGREGLPPETSQFWSLGVEEHYYLVIPVLLLGMFRRWDRHRIAVALVALAAVIPVWRVILGLSGAGFDRLYISTDTRIDSLLVGSAMALVANPALGDALPGGARGVTVMRWLPGAALVAFAASSVVPSQAFRLSVADCVQYICLVPIFWHIISRPTGLVGTLLNHRVTQWFGVLSYCIYLFHKLALGLVADVALPAPLIDLMALVVTTAVAYCVHVAVEQPCTRLRRRLEAPIGTSRVA